MGDKQNGPESRLATRRLILRRYCRNDRDAFITLNTDAAVRRHMDGALTPTAAGDLFDRMLSPPSFLGSESWAVELRDDGSYIGHAYLAVGSSSDAPEIGFLFFQQYWGRGYATEVACQVVRHAVEDSPHHRVVATVDTDHEAAIRVLEKAGMRLLTVEHDEQGPYAVYVADNLSKVEDPK